MGLLKSLSGYTKKTAEHLLLDAGAFFKNYNVGTGTIASVTITPDAANAVIGGKVQLSVNTVITGDTDDDFDSAVAAGKLLGATRGGGNFNAVPTLRQIEVDGVKGRAKGLTVIDVWDVNMTSNLLEVTVQSLKTALASANAEAVPGYTKITANNYIALSDYIENITWLGTLSGSSEPVIIQIYNALNTNGLGITTQDKNEVVTALTLAGHYDDTDLDSPPFAIFYPDDIGVTWSSSDPKVTISDDGLVTIGAGTVVGPVTITATSKFDNTKSDTCIITVAAA